MMGLFKLYLLWIIAFAAPIHVSCQELTSTLSSNNTVCRGVEVIFTCMIRGTQDLTTLALAWSSPEYIDNRLRFTTEDTSGENRTSVVNGNIPVNATLTSKTNISGVPVLVSELRLVANQASVVICESTTNGTSAMIKFNTAGLGAPQSISATEIPGSADNCVILVEWDPPENTSESDISHYIVYVPSQNMIINKRSVIITLDVPNCREDIRIIVAAVNRLGCVGMNSSVIPPNIFNVSQPTARSEPTPNISAIVGGASGSIILFVLIIATTIVILVVWLYNQQKKGYQKLYEDVKENAIESLQDLLQQLYVALKSESYVEIQIAARALIRKANKDYVQEAMLNVLEKIDLSRHENLHRALIYLEATIQDLPKDLKEILTDSVEATEKGNSSESMKKALDELKRKVREASPDTIKKHLVTVCEKLLEELNKRETDRSKSEPILSSGQASRGSRPPGAPSGQASRGAKVTPLNEQVSGGAGAATAENSV